MRWTPGQRSNQLEDRRGQGGVRGAGVSGGAIQLLFLLFRRFGIVGVLIGAAGLYFFTKFAGGGTAALTGESARGPEGDAAEERGVQFVSFVLDDAQSTWQQKLANEPEHYRLAKLVLFRGATRSECGLGQAEMGPFYCQVDEKVYLDLSFFEELSRRFGAAGDFAQAYVIAHEIGHHVQKILGTFARTEKAGARAQKGATGLSVRTELQADCYAGVWGNSANARNVLEVGDLEEALRAASVIGDDALQQKASGTVRPESFTHGSSAQRVRWFKRGFETGDLGACNTFSAKSL